MALNYFYKCNPKVAQAAGVTSFDRYTWPDGTFLLWGGDLKRIDRERYLLDPDGLLADLGAVRLTDPQAAEEQKHPSIRLPEALLPEYRWDQPYGAIDPASRPEVETPEDEASEDDTDEGEGGEP